MVDARLSLPGMQVDPPEETRKPLAWGQPLDFTWKFSAGKTGTYKGTALLHLNLVPQATTGDTNQLPLLARPVEIKNTGLLNITTVIWRMAGEFGILASVLILFRRIRKKS
jgi:hypothetical protein